MQTMLAGLVVVVVILTLVQAFASTDLAQRAGRARITLGWAAVAAGVAMLLRGSLPSAIGLLGFAAWALMQKPGGFAGLGLPWMILGMAVKGERHLTPHLDVMAEKATGRLRGKVLAGFFIGRRIEAMKPVEIAHLWADCQVGDTASARLLATHLDHLHPRWRADLHGQSAAGSDVAVAPGAMSPAQAYDILGLQPGATEADIRRSHRDLMLKLHPDRGGSHTLATTVNAAKDLLLRNART